MELFTNTFLTSHIISMTADNVLTSGLFNAAIFYIAQYVCYAVFYLLRASMACSNFALLRNYSMYILKLQNGINYY